jgi:hypothetical protein
MRMCLGSFQRQRCVSPQHRQAAEELVANIRTVRTFAQEAREKVTFASRVEESYLRAKEVCTLLRPSPPMSCSQLRHCAWTD